jgi:hypothetical protein
MYLSTNFDISNRSQTKAGTRFFIYNKISDCFLLFCILTIFYCGIVSGDSNVEFSLNYSLINELIPSIKSCLSMWVFILFCGLLFCTVSVKALQSIIYLAFSIIEKNLLSKFVFVQNAVIFLVGMYLYFRLSPFFGELNNMWGWVFVAIFVLSLLLYFMQKFFFIFSKAVGLFEKYVVEMVEPFVEFFVRTMSYICENSQKGNFQVRLIHSLIGLIVILGFVVLYYVVWLKW